MTDVQPESPTVPRRLPLPTTFGGVAALAEGPAWWLWAWQICLAILVAAVVVWAFQIVLVRPMEHAVAAMPEEARIKDGRLQWPEEGLRVLHEGAYVSLVADPRARREAGLGTDLTISLESHQLAIHSLFGWTSLLYPPALDLPLSRLGLSGAFAAWKVPVLVVLGIAVALGLLVSWWILATLYGIVLWCFSGPLGKDVTFPVAWRLGAAALLPAALLMTAAIALYATRQLGLVGLVVALPLHVVAGWIYVAGGWKKLHRAATPKNPFIPKTKTRAAGESPRPAANPFQSP